MPLPGDVSTFTLVGGQPNGYTDAAGNIAEAGVQGVIVPVDASGRPTRLTHVSDGATIVPIAVPFTIDSDGKWSVPGLAHTDDPNLSPVGFLYRVTFNVPAYRSTLVSKTIAVPTAAGSSVNYDLLQPSTDAPGILVPVATGPQGPAGPQGPIGPAGGVTSVVGDTGDVTGAQIAADPAVRAAYVAASDAVQLAVSGSGEDPAPAGTAAVGTQAVAARADHVHPAAGLYRWLGTGKDGAATFDGTTAVTGCSHSGSAYTATRDLHFTSATFSAGVTLEMGGHRLHVRGTINVPTGTATVTAAVVPTSGASIGSGLTNYSTYAASPFARALPLGPGMKGAAGSTGVGVAPAGAFQQWQGLSPVTTNSGNGGSGGSGAGGTGSGITNTVDAVTPLGIHHFAATGITYSYDTPNPWSNGVNNNVMGPVCGGRGGASGAGDGSNSGGAGGCGGNVVLVDAMKITGSLNVTAPGGAGGTPTTGNCGGGGGGTGGVVLVNAVDLTGWTGAASAPGGPAGAGVGTGAAGTAGGVGFAQAITWI